MQQIFQTLRAIPSNQRRDLLAKTCVLFAIAGFVRSMAGRKDLWDFARGLHAVQDSYSGSHDYRPWFGNARNMAHQGPDSHWHQDVIDATRDYLSGAGADALNPNMPPKPYYGRRPMPFWFLVGSHGERLYLRRRDLNYLGVILQSRWARWKDRRKMKRRVCSYDMFAVPDLPSS